MLHLQSALKDDWPFKIHNVGKTIHVSQRYIPTSQLPMDNATLEEEKKTRLLRLNQRGRERGKKWSHC